MSTATLTWANPTTRTDGTALLPGEIASVNVFDDATMIGPVSGAGTSFVTGVLTVGVHNFTVVVLDTSGHSSASSNVASLTVPAVLANPTAVANLTAVLNS